MRILFFSFCLIFSVKLASAQDIITLLDGSEVRARVINITPDQIAYLEYDHQERPIVYLSISAVHNIKYATGRREFFSTQPLPAPTAIETPTRERPVAEPPPSTTTPQRTTPSMEAVSPIAADRIDHRDYRRPSVTNIYINRGETYSERMISEVKRFDLSEQFDENRVEGDIIKASGGMQVREIKRYLEDNITSAIVDIWFPFDPVHNVHSIELIAHRGLYDATDVDVLQARASQRGKAILKDAGMHLLNRTYIVVYDFHNVRKINTSKERGFRGSCNVYLFRLDWNPQIENRFFDHWNDPNASRKVQFSVEMVGSMVGETMLTNIRRVQSKEGLAALVRRPDEELFSNLASALMDNASVYLAEANKDFRVKTGLVSTRPLRAPIGTKEGLHVDQRYFVYELSQSGDGTVRERRRGVIRATNNIVDNSRMATGDTGTSEFYQTHGRNLREGMLLKHNPEWGMSVSAFYGVAPNNHYGILLEGLVGVVSKSTDVREGTKSYIRINIYEYPDPRSYGAVGMGRDWYIARIFTLTPQMGINFSLIENSRSWGAEAGLSFSINLLHNFHVIGYGVGIYNSFINKFHGDEYYAAGIGLRIQY